MGLQQEAERDEDKDDNKDEGGVEQMMPTCLSKWRSHLRFSTSRAFAGGSGLSIPCKLSNN